MHICKLFLLAATVSVPAFAASPAAHAQTAPRSGTSTPPVNQAPAPPRQAAVTPPPAAAPAPAPAASATDLTTPAAGTTATPIKPPAAGAQVDDIRKPKDPNKDTPKPPGPPKDPEPPKPPDGIEQIKPTPPSDAFIGLETGLLLCHNLASERLFKKSVGVFFGANLNGGVRLARSDFGSVVVGGEVGFWTHSEKGYKQTNIPILVMAAYEFNLGQTFHVKAGIHAGGTYLTGDLKEYVCPGFGASHTFSFSNFVGTGGVHVGGSWDFAKHWSLSANYKFSASTASGIADSAHEAQNPLMHNITVGVAFRW